MKHVVAFLFVTSWASVISLGFHERVYMRHENELRESYRPDFLVRRIHKDKKPKGKDQSQANSSNKTDAKNVEQKPEKAKVESITTPWTTTPTPTSPTTSDPKITSTGAACPLTKSHNRHFRVCQKAPWQGCFSTEGKFFLDCDQVPGYTYGCYQGDEGDNETKVMRVTTSRT